MSQRERRNRQENDRNIFRETDREVQRDTEIDTERQRDSERDREKATIRSCHQNLRKQFVIVKSKNNSGNHRSLLCVLEIGRKFILLLGF